MCAVQGGGKNEASNGEGLRHKKKGADGQRVEGFSKKNLWCPAKFGEQTTKTGPGPYSSRTVGGKSGGKNVRGAREKKGRRKPNQIKKGWESIRGGHSMRETLQEWHQYLAESSQSKGGGSWEKFKEKVGI